MLHNKAIPSVLILLLGLGGLASGASITMTMSDSFGAVPPSGWPTVTFEDVVPGTVKITMDLTALSGLEKVTGWYFNTAFDFNAGAYTWLYDAASTGPAALLPVAVDPTWNTNDPAWKADGDGYYDIRLDFSNNGDTFAPGEKVVYSVTGPGLDATDFDVLGNPGPGAGSPGPYRSVVRIQSTGADGNGSDWIGDGDDIPVNELVPEPGTMVLLGTGLLGLGWLARRRRR